MSNIVTITQGKPITTSLAIAEGVNRPHKNIIELIRENIKDFEEFGPLAFETRKGEHLPQGGFAKATEIAILNEHQATMLVTFMRNIGVVKEFKKRLVKAFFQMRDELDRRGSQIRVPQSLPEALRLAAEQAEEIEKQTAQILEFKPKAQFYDQVAKAQDALSVGEAAKVIGTGRRRLFALMRQHGWVTRKNEPYQSKIETGCLDVKLGSWEHPDHGIQQSVTALVTGKGLTRLQKLWSESLDPETV